MKTPLFMICAVLINERNICMTWQSGVVNIYQQNIAIYVIIIVMKTVKIILPMIG